jgi:hypothetical protein
LIVVVAVGIRVGIGCRWIRIGSCGERRRLASESTLPEVRQRVAQTIRAVSAVRGGDGRGGGRAGREGRRESRWDVGAEFGLGAAEGAVGHGAHAKTRVELTELAFEVGVGLTDRPRSLACLQSLVKGHPAASHQVCNDQRSGS